MYCNFQTSCSNVFNCISIIFCMTLQCASGLPVRGVRGKLNHTQLMLTWSSQNQHSMATSPDRERISVIVMHAAENARSALTDGAGTVTTHIRSCMHTAAIDNDVHCWRTLPSWPWLLWTSVRLVVAYFYPCFYNLFQRPSCPGYIYWLNDWRTDRLIVLRHVNTR